MNALQVQNTPSKHTLESAQYRTLHTFYCTIAHSLWKLSQSVDDTEAAGRWYERYTLVLMDDGRDSGWIKDGETVRSLTLHLREFSTVYTTKTVPNGTLFLHRVEALVTQALQQVRNHPTFSMAAAAAAQELQDTIHELVSTKCAVPQAKPVSRLHDTIVHPFM
uniref:DNA-directed RNA polymerase subunit omega n=1 Tax=Lygus hesperus TaxID=30085 RepID=A0A0A9WE95_LYGHE